MHKTLIKTVVSLVLCVAYSQASAWTAVAHSSDSGTTFTHQNASTAIEAKQKALEGCSKMGLNCVVVGNAIHGPGAMIVVGGDKGIGWVFDRNIEKAVQNAEKNCTSHQTNCRVLSAAWDNGPSWASVALANDYQYVIYNNESQEKAEREAIRKCELKTSTPGSCKTLRTFGVTGWITTVESNSARGLGLNESRELALEGAKRECEKNTKQGDACSQIEELKNNGWEAAPPAFKKLLAQIESKKTATTKSTEAVRYTESCNNADCTRKYNDGRVVNYKACVNPATLLPMNDPVKLGGCSGTDSRGNLFGMKSM